MNEIWKKRRASYQKMLLKYLRYVFNDHFVIALLFLFGASGLSYSNFLKSLSGNENIWWAQPTALFILVIMMHVNQIATFLKEPDKVFLLPQEKEIRQYIKNSGQYSTFIAVTVQLALYVVLTPFLLFAAKLTGLNVIFLAITQVVLTIDRTKRQAMGLFITQNRVFSKEVTFSWLIPGLILAAGVYLPAYVACAVAILLLLFTTSREQKLLATKIFDWRYAIDQEAARMARLYRFFNMFTDVGSVSPKPKRRRYLDRLLPKYSAKPEGLFKYMFWRAFVRSGEFSNLYLRLTLLCLIVLFFIPNYWVSLLIAAVFVYLLGFQLMPLFVTYDEVVFMHTYPINIQKKFLAFSKMLFFLLFISSVFFFIPIAIQGPGIIKALSALVLLVAESALIARIYSKTRINKMS